MIYVQHSTTKKKPSLLYNSIEDHWRLPCYSKRALNSKDIWSKPLSPVPFVI